MVRVSDTATFAPPFRSLVPDQDRVEPKTVRRRFREDSKDFEVRTTHEVLGANFPKARRCDTRDLLVRVRQLLPVVHLH